MQLTKTHIDQLVQLRTLTWDGNLISKDATKDLHLVGLITRSQGWNVVRNDGIQMLIDLEILKP